ncbi:MAG: response regulator [Xanthomonadales bacterium]|nr:response regulator [Xanthomonadales bacterium]
MPGEHAINQAQTQGVLLLNEPDESVRDALTLLLQAENWTVRNATDCDNLDALMASGEITAVISEASLPDCTPGEILERCKQFSVPVVFTGHDLPLQGAVDLIRQGAVDFLDKPFPQSRLLDLLTGLLRAEN